MKQTQDEQPLGGGYVSQVVRVGNTVRRSAGSSTPTVHRLLAHVRARGVTWVPEPQGYDDQGREVLSYIPGCVPHAMPPWIWSRSVLGDAAGALRQWHDATGDFDRDGAVWGFEAHEPAEVICHNDFAPYNCVFQSERLVGVIDFGFCSPGSRLWDLVYTAYRFVPVMPSEGSEVADGGQERSQFGVQEMRDRLALFLEAYAGQQSKLSYSFEEVIGMLAVRLQSVALWTDAHSAKTGDPSLRNHGRMYRAHAEWVSRL